MENDEEGDYIPIEKMIEHSLGLDRTYPQQYYRDVEVCENCYKMYRKIDEERQKCIDKKNNLSVEGNIYYIFIERENIELTNDYKRLQNAKLSLTKVFF